MQTTRIHDLGALLSEAREDKQLSIADVCERLKLREQLVRSIETNDFENLPAAAFVRGYLRSYALLLGLDPNVILAEYNRIAPADPDLKALENEQLRQSKAPQMIFWGTALLGMVLIGLMVAWGLDYIEDSRFAMVEQKPVPVVEEPGTFTEIMPESVAPSISDASISESAETKLSPAQSSELVPPSVEPVAPAKRVDKQVTENMLPAEQGLTAAPIVITPIAPSGDDNLIIVVTGRSWVDVKDANGYTLIYEMMTETSGRAVLQGQAPFDFLLGNAPEVVIEVNGVPFDQSRFIRANASAKFKVSAP